MCGWGDLFYDSIQYRDAIADFDRAIQLDPDNADAYYNARACSLARKNC